MYSQASFKVEDEGERGALEEDLTTEGDPCDGM